MQLPSYAGDIDPFWVSRKQCCLNLAHDVSEAFYTLAARGLRSRVHAWVATAVDRTGQPLMELAARDVISEIVHGAG